MSVCAQVSQLFVSSVSCKQGKSWQKIYSTWKMWMFSFEQKVSTDVEDSKTLKPPVSIIDAREQTKYFRPAVIGS